MSASIRFLHLLLYLILIKPMREVFFSFHCPYEEEPKAQSGTTTYPRSRGLKVATSGIEPWQTNAKSPFLATALFLQTTSHFFPQTVKS